MFFLRHFKSLKAALKNFRIFKSFQCFIFIYCSRELLSTTLLFFNSQLLKIRTCQQFIQVQSDEVCINY